MIWMLSLLSSLHYLLDLCMSGEIEKAAAAPRKEEAMGLMRPPVLPQTTFHHSSELAVTAAAVPEAGAHLGSQRAGMTVKCAAA
jgi:hypothetical protein